MKSPLFLCFFGLLFFACNEPLDEVEVKDDSGQVIERFTVLKGTFTRDGRYQAFYPSGELMEEAYYANDTLNGLRRMFYENGTVQIEEHYEMGKFIGSFKAYHANGKLELAGEYINNAMEGEWRGYYDNGQLREVVLFSGNQENGPFVEYYDNGNVKAEGTYLNGDTEQGLLQEYNEEGVLVRKAECDNGACKTIWTLESGDVQSN
ncbi:MAG: toxin-antitoxin system YwqK family antitoxin [Saprospiraceae bacterium]|nr:toxin-antitoxin system YwqK family antitoxin [Saprospiraceae bacterium]